MVESLGRKIPSSFIRDKHNPFTNGIPHVSLAEQDFPSHVMAGVWPNPSPTQEYQEMVAISWNSYL